MFSLNHHFPWVGNFTWSIMIFLKAFSPEPHRAALRAARHCIPVTSLWQSARCDCSICAKQINSSVWLCVRIPKVGQEAQHRVCTCLACWLELNTLFKNQDTQRRKWSKFLLPIALQMGLSEALSAEFCLGCSESKWFISYRRGIKIVWCLRPGRKIQHISYSILPFNHSFTHLSNIYWIPIIAIDEAETKTNICYPHGAYLMVEMNK